MKGKFKVLLILCLSLVTLVGCSTNKSNGKNSSNGTNNTNSTNSIVSNKTAKSLGNNYNNLANNGSVDISNGWIYYSMADGLYRCKQDGTKKERIYFTNPKYGNNGNVFNINVVDDWIYFSYDGYYKIKTDGSELEQLFQEDHVPTNYILNNKVYNSSGFTINMDGSNRKELFENVYGVSVYSGSYYIDGQNIYFASPQSDPLTNRTTSYNLVKSDLDGKNVKTIAKDTRADYIEGSGKWLYYYNVNNHGKLYRIQKDGKNKELINDEVGDFIITDNNIIYCADNEICISDLDGKNKKVLTETIENNRLMFPIDYLNLQYHDDWLYYYQATDNVLSLCRIKFDGSKKETVAKNTDKFKKIKTKYCEDTSKLTKTVKTIFPKAESLDSPTFSLSYYPSWYQSERIHQQGDIAEGIVLKNRKGTTITYMQYIATSTYMLDNSVGSKFISRTKATKVKDIKFKATTIQDTDYSKLGDFVIAKLKTTGEMDSFDEDFKKLDGVEIIAIIPKSKLGVNDYITLTDDVEYGFDYPNCTSIIATPANGKKFTKEEQKEVINILSSFNEVIE